MSDIVERLRNNGWLGGPDGVVSQLNARCDHLGMRLGEVIRERDALLEQVAAQKLTILNAWQRGEHLEDEASRWEERARHVGWRDEHGA